jgi:hypothetical protein
MSVNLSNVAASRTSWPDWRLRGRIKKVDKYNNVLEDQWDCCSEYVRISPTFRLNGRTYRVRPERPAVFFAYWLYERGILPERLTPEEAASEAGLELLDPLWERYKAHFFKLESPNAACDSTQPSHRVGFSFCVLQAQVELMGSVRSSKGSHGGMMPAHVQGNGENHEALRKKIEEMRSRAGARPEQSTPAKGKK